jgi:hypothetical protein
MDQYIGEGDNEKGVEFYGKFLHFIEGNPTFLQNI